MLFKPESGFNAESDLSSIDLSVFTNRRKDHAASFGIGDVISTMIRENLQHNMVQDGRLTDDERSDPALSIVAGHTLSAADLEVTGENVLGKVGLESVGESINIKDKDLFVRYLQSLPVQPTQSQVEGLKEIGDLLIRTFRKYDLEGEDADRGLDMISSMPEVCREYERLGIVLQPFKKYSEYATKGILKEYLLAEKWELDKPFESGHYHLEWHRDATVKSLQDEWDGVLNTIATIASNPAAAAELLERAKATASEALEHGIAELTTWGEDTTDRYDFAEGFLPILESARLRLQEF